MAISSSTRKAGPFLGNDATTVFPFAFKVFTSADLRVVRTNALGVESDLVLDTDYTVALNANQDNDPGGTVTRGTALPTGERLTITSDVEALQPLVLTNNGGFYPRVINDAFDKITIIAQQLIEQVGRSLKLPISSSASATLPDPVANRLIAWNSSANGFTNVNPASLATVAAYADANLELFTGNGTQTAFTLAQDPAVLANLDVSISGVTQVGGEDFTWIGTTLTFVVAPPTGTRIQVRYTRAIPPVDLAAAVAAAEADRVATAADRVQTGLDVIAAEADRVATAADRVQTGLDRVATAADRVQTGIDRAAAAVSAASSAADAAAAADRILYPEQYGAVGDGSTNDATAMQNAITAAAAANAVLKLRPGRNYRCATGLTIPANSTIDFQGGTISTAANISLLSITTSNVTLIRPKLRGPSGTYNATSIGIYLSGTVNGAGVAPTFISDIKILEPDIQDFGYLCIQPLYVERMVITNPVAKNFGYGFMVTQGARDCVGVGGIFLDATGLVAGGDLECFAVSWSGNDGSTDYVRYPNSERCVWFGGFAKGFSWQPFDTHGGVDCGFVAPVVRGSRRAVWLTARGNILGPVRCFARDVDAVNTSAAFATYADGNEQRGDAFLIAGAADTNASTRAQGCYISGRATGFGGLVGTVGAAKVQYCDDACGMDVELINPYGAGLEINTGARGFYRAVIDNVQSPGTGVSTTSPRYVSLTSGGAQVVSVRLDVNLLRSNPTLNTYVGTRAFTSSTGLSASSVTFTRFMSDPAIDLTVSQDGIALGEYPASFLLSVAGIDSVTNMNVTIRREGPWAIMSSTAIVGGTSNATAFTLGTTIPLPTYMRPSGTRRLYAKVMDNSTATWGEAELSTGGVFTLYRDMVGNTWTGSGTKRIYDFTWRWLV